MFNLNKGFILPRMVRVCQLYGNTRLEHPELCLINELNKPEILVHLQPGQRIALAVGSRGIKGIHEIVKTIVLFLRGKNTFPFIIPAMGSHGGATANGQREILESFGITEDYVKAPIVSSMETELIENHPVSPLYFDKQAYHADLVIPINKIKAHTSFNGKIESGLMKMLVIGLGKHKGAEAAHKMPYEQFETHIINMANKVILKTPVKFGIGVVEDHNGDISIIKAIDANNFEDEETKLLVYAKKIMPQLPSVHIHVLIVDEFGKDISGTGMDPNVISRSQFKKFDPNSHFIADRIIVRDVTDHSFGNVAGIGLADIITKKLFDRIDFTSTYTNVITDNALQAGFIPVICDNDESALNVALQTCPRIKEYSLAQIIRIKNTKDMNKYFVSESLWHQIEKQNDIQRIGEFFDITYDPVGNFMFS